MKKSNNTGITLIALIITIIVLLILSTICLNMLLGNSGIIEKARIAKEKTNQSQEKEEQDIAKLEEKVNEYESTRAGATTKSKILFDGAMNSGTITFEDDLINNYNYYEFIFGAGNKETVYSQIISKEFLQFPVTGSKHLGGLVGTNAMCSIYLTDVTENSITFLIGLTGGSYNGSTGYLYQIIGRNNL